MSAARTDAEVLKLARLLDVAPDELAFLAHVDAAALRELREQATEALFAADRRKLHGVAAASRKLPMQVVAAIGQHVFGGLLCARVAGLLEARHAIDLGRRLPPPFLAEIAVHADPRQIADVIAGMDADRVAAVAWELSRRGEDVAMGRFVGHMPEDALAACVDVLDDSALLRVAFVVEGEGALDRVMALLPDARLAGILSAAVDEDLWAEGLELLRGLSPARHADLLAAAKGLDDRVVDALVRAAEDTLRLADPPGRAAEGAKRAAAKAATSGGKTKSGGAKSTGSAKPKPKKPAAPAS